MPRKFVIASALLALVGLFSPLSRLSGRGNGGEGFPSRNPWTTSPVIGSPERPRPYGIERAFPTIKLYRPLLSPRIPASDRVVAPDHERRVYPFPTQPDA